jgi:hypothetical protein
MIVPPAAAASESGGQVSEHDPEHRDRNEADQHQADHRQPLAGGQPHAEGSSGQRHERDRRQRYQKAARDLGAEVVAGGERRDPQLTRPAARSEGRD